MQTAMIKKKPLLRGLGRVLDIATQGGRETTTSRVVTQTRGEKMGFAVCGPTFPFFGQVTLAED